MRFATRTAGSIFWSIRSLSARRRSCEPYVEMSREGWHLAMDVERIQSGGRLPRGSAADDGRRVIVTLSYYGGEKVIPGYNMMGVCKAALEHSVRYLAWDLGRRNIRVNCIAPDRCGR